MALHLDRARLLEVVEAIADRLEGEWLLVGGGAAILWFGRDRETEDVDLVGLAGTMEERLRLFELAGDLGLPVEALNSAADFFVRRVDGWRDQIAPARAGARGRVFRPTPTLFLLTKIRRLSENDLEDTLAAIVWARSGAAAELDAARVAGALDTLPRAESPGQDQRRRRLREVLAE